MPFAYRRTVHFADTDAAGVVFFANCLAICHEAYEEALGAAGIEPGAFFSDAGSVVPIVASEASYLRPLRPGDRLLVSVAPSPLSESSYEIRYEITRLGRPDKLACKARTEHVCIGSKTRRRLALPPALAAWVKGG